ncbi:YqcC family protein [Vibrio sp. S11_S32]|uniref:YqcC family protein n=1 Tax=Vibrio sp. S11_S32 TaxID=2720225 RepID=UPI001681A03D|nr:YqcC family protein [Vibrio sp. S11_S32]MBD1575088.1 YqcC family protein [Vibrio sp. S11_S32]
MIDYTKLIDALEQLEDKMIELTFWEAQAPSAEALASNQPFSVDTLSPTQWLQWVFMPKMRSLMASDCEMPAGFEISPYFEQASVRDTSLNDLLLTIKRIDDAVK